MRLYISLKFKLDSDMMWYSRLLLLCLIQSTFTVKVKVIMRSDEDSKIEDEESHTENWDYKKKIDITVMPFSKKSAHRHIGAEKPIDYEEEKPTTEKLRPIHPNEMIFPLIYHQIHINSMFKFAENWYTWSTEKRTDGSKAINYYICSDEPKRCDEVGWERTDNLPRCAFQIDSLMTDDRACLNTFGVEPRTNGVCDGGEQMKVSDIVRACGPRIRSLWRFFRVGRRPANAAKPADVNSLICEDEEECFITIEYRIHHDRITFSLHEPSRGQTFKSALKRDIVTEDDNKVVPTTEPHTRAHRSRKSRDEEQSRKKFHIKSRSKVVEGKGVLKERNDSVYPNRVLKNKIKVKDDISDDVSDK